MTVITSAGLWFWVTLVILACLFAFGLILLTKKEVKKPDLSEIRARLSNSNLSLKDRIEIINGKSTGGTFSGYFFKVKMTLAKMNKLDEYRKIKIIAGLAAFLGALGVVITKNYFFFLVIPPAAFLLPFEFVKMRYKRFVKNLEEDLETSISLITISYSRTANLISAVEECLPSLPPNTKHYFEDFLFEVTNVDANTRNALLHLKVRVDNAVFQQWVDRLIVCQNDRSAISSLEIFINEYADNRSIQNELDSEIFGAKVELWMMTAFILVPAPLLYIVQKSAFEQLTTTLIGKFVMFFSFTIGFILIIVGNKVAKPVKFRTNKK